MSSSSSDSGSETEYGPRERGVPMRKRIVTWRRRHVHRRFESRDSSSLRFLTTNNNNNAYQYDDKPLRIRRCMSTGTDRSYLVPRMDVILMNKVPGTLDYLFDRVMSRNLEELHLEGFAFWRRQLSTGRGRLYLPRLKLLTMNALHPNFETDLQLDAPSLRVLKIHCPVLSHGGRTAQEITNQIEELHVSFGEFHNTIVADESVSFKNLRRLSLEGDDDFFLEEHFARFASQLTYAEVSTENPDLVDCLARQAINLETFVVYAEAFVHIMTFRKLLNLRELVFTGYYSLNFLGDVFLVLPNLTSLSVEIDMAPHFITPILHELEVVIREEEFDNLKVKHHFNRINHHVVEAIFRVQQPNVYRVPIDVISVLTNLRSLTLVRVELQQTDVRELLDNLSFYLRRIRFSKCNILTEFGETETDAFFAHLRTVYRYSEIIVE